MQAAAAAWGCLHCVTSRNPVEADPQGIEQRAAGGWDCRERRAEAARSAVQLAMAAGSAVCFWPFGVGGLIHAAVGLAGGMGGLLTKRAGLLLYA